MNISVTYHGPIFSPFASHRVKTAIEDTVQELMEMGEQRLDEMLRPRPAGVYLSVGEAGKGRASTGHYRRSLHGERKGYLARIDDSKVVYGPWLEGTSSRNQSTRFKGYGSFRRTTEWLQKQTPRVLKAHIGRLVRRLGG